MSLAVIMVYFLFWEHKQNCVLQCQVEWHCFKLWQSGLAIAVDSSILFCNVIQHLQMVRLMLFQSVAGGMAIVIIKVFYFNLSSAVLNRMSSEMCGGW